MCVAMVGGVGLQNWPTLFVVVSSGKDSMHARFHMWSVCGHAWWHLRDPLATRAGSAKPRMGSQKSKQKSPRTVSRHPPLYLSHTSNFHHNHCLGTLGKTRSRCAYGRPFVHLVLSLTAHGGQKRILGRTKSERLLGQKAEIFLRRGIARVGSTRAIVAQEREAIMIKTLQFSSDTEVTEIGGKCRIQESRILKNYLSFFRCRIILRSVSLL